MKTILVWLLVSATHQNIAVVERFADQKECMRVRDLLPYAWPDQKSQTRCIQSRIMVPQ